MAAETDVQANDGLRSRSIKRDVGASRQPSVKADPLMVDVPSMGNDREAFKTVFGELSQVTCGLIHDQHGESLRHTLIACLQKLDMQLSESARKDCHRLVTETIRMAYGVGVGELPTPAAQTRRNAS